MNALTNIDLAIEFVSKQVDPGGGGGGTVTPAAQTGDFAIWAIFAILFVGIIAYCMFRFSRVFNGEFVTAAASPKHARNAHRGGRFATTKAVLIAAIVGLIACLSITTTTAIASNANNGIVTIPDKIQIAIDEETGQPDPVSFQFFNDSTDYTYFNKSSVSLSSEAQSVSSPEDWDLTLNTLGTCIFTGNPNGDEYTINDTKVFEPLQKSDSSLSFGLFNFEAAKALIGKEAFEVTLTCSTDVAFAPVAKTGLTYNKTEQIGVEGGDNFSISGNTGTIPGTYTATASLTNPAIYVWEDGTKTDKQITWSIAEAPVNVPVAKTGLVYEESKEQTGVEDGEGFSVSNNKATNAGNYTATATLDAYYIWSDASHDTKAIPWSIAKAQGAFSVEPAAIKNLVYTGNPMLLVTAGQSTYTTNIEYSANGGTSFSPSIPQETYHGTYTVLAHVCADPNHEQSANVEISGITIEKAKITSITVTGATGTADFELGANYVFPNFDPPNPQPAYSIVDYKVEGDVPLLFKAEKVTPRPTDPTKYQQIKIDNAKESDIGVHVFVLPDEENWAYNDDNVTVKDGAWDITNGSFTINPKAFAEISVAADPATAVIGQTVKYTVSMTNKLTTAITGAELWFGNEKQEETINLAVGETKTHDINYEVKDADFLYYPTMTKNFTLKYQTYSTQTSFNVTLQYKHITPPTLYNAFYDGKEHNYELTPGEGYTFFYGVNKATNAGVYYAWVLRDAGYIWQDLPYFDFRVYEWQIKKINVNVHFTMPQGKDHFEATFGDDWKVEDHPIIGTTTDVTTLTEDLETILGGSPECITSYTQYSKADTYSLIVNLPAATGWSPNYNITKNDSYLVVSKKDISITWPATKEFTYTGSIIPISITINGNLQEHAATLKVETYTDQQRQIQKDFKDTGDYYASAYFKADNLDNYNYKITGSTDKPTDVFKITDTPGPTEKKPKAVLTESSFLSPRCLSFVYDDVVYEPGKNYVLEVYDIINTSYDPEGNATKAPGWYSSTYLSSIERVNIDASFKDCDKCSDGTTSLNSMDLWFANMTSLKTIDGLESIKSGIMYKFNGTFMNCGASSFAKLDMSSLLTANTAQCEAVSMFDSSNFKEIVVPNQGSDSSAKFFNVTKMFYNCRLLQSVHTAQVNERWFVNWDASLYISMFENCTSLESIDCLTFEPTGRNVNMTNMFKGCEKLKVINVTSSLADWSSFLDDDTTTNMFEGCTLLPNYSSSTEGTRDSRYAKPSTEGGFFTVVS